MKGIVKKNQIIITSLAILIAVAGYLNYTEKNVLKQTGKAKEVGEQLDDTIPMSGNSTLDNETSGDLTGSGDDNQIQTDNAQGETEGNAEIDSSNGDSAIDDGNAGNGEDANTNEAENGSDYDEDSVPGEAIFTNVGTFSANARLQREQLRAKNKETLLNMINSGNLSEEQKSDITNEMLHITEIAELENEVETLLEAKGIAGAVVSISDNSVDVVVSMTDVGDKERAQIEDIVKRKTNVEVSNIVITPITVEN